MSILLFLVLLPGLCFGTHPFLSSQYSKLRDANGAQDINLVLALKPQNTNQLESTLASVSNPRSSSYGQYLKPSEISSISSPSAEAIQAVEAWLKGYRYEFNAHKDLIYLSMKVSEAEQFFGTDLQVFAHQSQPSVTRLRAATPLSNVPAHIASLIDVYGGLNSPIHRYRRFTPGQATQATGVEIVSGNAAAPRVVRLMGGDGEVAVTVAIDNAASVSEVNVLTSQERHGALRQDFTSSMITCTTSSCSLVVSNLRNYAKTTFQVRVSYSNGSISDWSAVSAPIFPQAFVNPDFLTSFYRIPSGLSVKNPKNIVAVAEFLEQYYNPDDLTRFFRLMGVPDQKVALLIGPNNATLGSITGGEAQLDIQYLMAISVNASTWFWSVAGRNEATQDPSEEPFLTWLFQVSNVTDSSPYPLVHSLSYDDTEETIPRAYADRLNVEFVKLGLRGVTLLFAAGDDGVASFEGRQDPTRCQKSHPVFPGGSPYVTAVGGTQATYEGAPICSQSVRGVTSSCSVLREKACSSDTDGVITTGGGFSNYYPRQWWQEEAVKAYLNNPDAVLPPAAFFNASGRAYPDISGYAVNYLVLMGQELNPTAGTSASTPLLAGIITLLNEIRLARGLPSMGFLNPWLYDTYARFPEAFNDVVVGNNRCLVRGIPCCQYGFTATRGWDATTGVGTPRFDILASIVAGDYENPTPGPVGPPGPAGHGPSALNIVALIISIVAILISSYVFVRSRSSSSNGDDYVIQQ